MTRAQSRILPRLGIIAVWIGILVWIPFEDQTPVAAIVFGLLLSGLFALRIISRLANPGLLLCAAAGLTAGLAAGPLAVGLMILKSGLHSHGVPDFSVADLTAVLQRTPVYALAGLLVGAGLKRCLSVE